MLTPEYLDHIADPVVQLFQDVEDDILRDMARRIKKMDGLTDTASYQAWRLEQTRLLRQDIVTRLSQMSGKTQAEIRKILQEAGTETLLSDDAIYTAAGKVVGLINDNPALLNILNAGYQQTAGTFQNLTATTANTATKQFENALDRAWLQVSSGAFDYQTVLRRTVDALASEGIKAILYPTGHSDTLEVATRRALLTGVNQTAAKLQIARMDEMECDLVEVTAHTGARPSHAVWQGKIYSRSGKSSKYPPLSVTGYGTGAGLCGWNCRHNFYPFFEGLSVPNYTEEALERLNRKEFTYKGKEMTRYEATQYQRYLERNIRAWKRKYLAEEAAGVDTTRTSVKLAEWRARQKDFLDKTGLDEDNIRHRVSGFGHRQASKAVAQAKRAKKLEELKRLEEQERIKRLEKQKKDDIIKEEIRKAGGLARKAEVHLLPRKIDVNDLKFDDNHINKERNHEISEKQARELIRKAKISVTVWNGKYERYYGEEGAVYVHLENKTIRTAYSAAEYDEKVGALLEVLKKHGI